MIRAWWQNLAPNDRRMLGIGGVVVALLLAWALLWHPLAMRRIELQQEVSERQRDLAFVRAGAVQIEQQRATGSRSRGERQGRSLLALADATARSGGLESVLKHVEPVGARSVKLSFESASFDTLVRWIEGLSTSYGVEVTDFSADRADGIGLVNARVTLQDAP